VHLYLCLIRIDLSFLENHGSNRVVIIGLELLSLTCPGLGLGSDIVAPFILVSPCHYLSLWLFDPISMENMIWGDRIGTCPV
jgi:hypothetical protein